jgi:hypothetical protein
VEALFSPSPPRGEMKARASFPTGFASGGSAAASLHLRLQPLAPLGRRELVTAGCHASPPFGEARTTPDDGASHMLP